MTHLVIDIGNTLIKAAAIEECEIHQLESNPLFTNELRSAIAQMVAKYRITKAIISSTRGEQREIIDTIEKMVDTLILLTPQTPIPIKVNYLTPNTLGRDRVAAAIGANSLYGDGDKLIIDCGTAITIDHYTKANGFEGGFISPGISMRFKALNEQTATLPLCTPLERWSSIAVGRTTEESIVGGVMRGVYNEIEGHIASLGEKKGKYSIIFVGGDAKYFDKQIKNAIFADRNLVIVGLNTILHYNV